MMNKRIFLNVVGLAIFACTIVIATYSLPPGYESNSGPAKLAVLWQNILSDNNHSGSWFGFLDMSMLLLRSDWVTGHTLSDIMPDGRKKLIHTVGGIAKGKIVWTNTNKYTGMFKAANNVLIRLSTAQEASVSDGLTPAMAIKAFRDGVPSGNIIGMYELDGQPSLNFFEHNLCTHLADRPTLPLKLKLLGAKFKLQSSYPGCLGLSEFASFTETGSKVLSPSFPWALVFQVNPALTKSMSTNTNTDIAGALVRGVPQGTILYKIYAVPDPWSPNQLEELGYIQTTSPFRASAFGDLTVFFKHTFEEEDLTIRTDWADYFGDSTAQRWQTEGRAIYEPFLPAF
jgi:hypothetical protein